MNTLIWASAVTIMESLYRINLYQEKGTGISINIDALINKDNGDLVIEGQDYGSSINSMFGNSDYEYFLTIRSENKEGLLKELLSQVTIDKSISLDSNKSKDEILLSLVKDRFANAQAVSKLKDYCLEKGIKTEFFSFS